MPLAFPSGPKLIESSPQLDATGFQTWSRRHWPCGLASPSSCEVNLALKQMSMKAGASGDKKGVGLTKLKRKLGVDSNSVAILGFEVGRDLMIPKLVKFLFSRLRSSPEL